MNRWDENDPPFFTHAVDLPCLYRVIPEETFAKQFEEGRNIRITTIGTCRTIEDPNRRDEREGELAYHAYDLYSPDEYDDDPAEMQALARMDIVIEEGCAGILIHGVTKRIVEDDAYVLCFTERRGSDHMSHMGNHCIRVVQHDEALRRLTRAIRDMVGPVKPLLGRVRYASRDNDARTPHTSRPALVKDPDKYAKEQEIRMLWYPESPVPIGQLKPFNVDCPELAELCKLLDD